MEKKGLLLKWGQHNPNTKIFQKNYKNKSDIGEDVEYQEHSYTTGSLNW